MLLPSNRSAADVRDDRNVMIGLYREMLRIRLFEQRVAQLYRDGVVPGFVHLSIGQEAVAVGTCVNLTRHDWIASTHRGHGHCLAKGVEMEAMFAELFGKDSGACGGRGGSMHIADPSVGMLGANGIVGAGLPLAVGAAVAAQLRNDGSVAVAFFGDGAVATGAFHEAVNLASLWKLPALFVCENNGYSEFSAAASQHPVPIVDRADGYGIEGVQIDGSDVAVVAAKMSDVIGRVRIGNGPVLVEMRTHRWHGHYEGDPQRYRPDGELAGFEEQDPIARAHSDLSTAGVAVAQLREVNEGVEREIEAALTTARAAPWPLPGALHDFVTAPVGVREETPTCEGDLGPWRMMDAVHDALEHELEEDPDVFLAGIDVGAGGNVFAITRGLWERFPSRVRDTPISETAIVGLAVGASMVGMRPVVEIMYLDFIGVCFDQLLNQAAKMRFMTGGAVTLPLTVRTQTGSGRSSGSQHSQSLEALLAHVPGLTVVMPSTAADAYGMLRAAIRDPNPVIVIENRALYGRKEPRVHRGHFVPLRKAIVRRPGTDVTVVAASRMVHEALTAAEQLDHEGISVEVVDLRTVAPFDQETVLASVRKTSRLVVAHDAVVDFGIGAEITAVVTDKVFWYLDAPIRRVGAPFTPAPYSPELERLWVPGATDIVNAVRDVCNQ